MTEFYCTFTEAQARTLLDCINRPACPSDVTNEEAAERRDAKRALRTKLKAIECYRGPEHGEWHVTSKDLRLCDRIHELEKDLELVRKQRDDIDANAGMKIGAAERDRDLALCERDKAQAAKNDIEKHLRYKIATMEASIQSWREALAKSEEGRMEAVTKVNQLADMTDTSKWNELHDRIHELEQDRNAMREGVDNFKCEVEKAMRELELD